MRRKGRYWDRRCKSEQKVSIEWKETEKFRYTNESKRPKGRKRDGWRKRARGLRKRRKNGNQCIFVEQQIATVLRARTVTIFTLKLRLKIKIQNTYVYYNKFSPLYPLIPRCKPAILQTLALLLTQITKVRKFYAVFNSAT